jgi:hypothetical protein
MNMEKVVDKLLEGAPLSILLTDPSFPSIFGKYLDGVECPHCQTVGELSVTKEMEADQGFYTVLVTCDNCSEVTEMEVVVQEGTKMDASDKALMFEGRVFGIYEGGIMTGNYLKIHSGTRGFILDQDGQNLIVFDEPDEGTEFKHLNTHVTFKVLSFRNELAKIISMVKDNANKYPAGTMFLVDKREIQQHAKVSSPRQHGSMAGRYAN